MIILEGIDGTGKTTLAEALEKYGYKTYHFGYDASAKSIERKYLDVLNLNTEKMILDRSFISELVYGPVLRGNCRLDKTQTINLLEHYKKAGSTIVYLKADKDTIISRRKTDEKDFAMLTKHFDELNSKYDTAMWIASQFVNVREINTSDVPRGEMLRMLEGLIDVGSDICR